jgi:hypothetical protein
MRLRRQRYPQAMDPSVTLLIHPLGYLDCPVTASHNANDWELGAKDAVPAYLEEAGRAAPMIDPWNTEFDNFPTGVSCMSVLA